LMMPKNPPAFPDPSGTELGVTMRDYFAAKAMEAMIPLLGKGYTTHEGIAEAAYAQADAMMKAAGYA
jgi:hypothetical protein